MSTLDLAELPVAQRLESLGELDAHLSRRALAAREGADLAEAAEAGAREVVTGALDVAARLQQRALLEASLVAAEEQRPEHEARRELLERARRAIPVRPLVEIVDAATEQVATLRAAVVASRIGRGGGPHAPGG